MPKKFLRGKPAENGGAGWRVVEDVKRRWGAQGARGLCMFVVVDAKDNVNSRFYFTSREDHSRNASYLPM